MARYALKQTRICALDIGDAAFMKWWEQKHAGGEEAVDPTVAVIEDALGKVMHKLKFDERCQSPYLMSDGYQ